MNFIETEVENGTEYLPENYKETTLKDNEVLMCVCFSYFKQFIGNTFNEEKFKTLVSCAIKEREEFILNKNSIVMATNLRIINALNYSSKLSCKFFKYNILLVQKEEVIHSWEKLRRNKTIKGLKLQRKIYGSRDRKWVS